MVHIKYLERQHKEVRELIHHIQIQIDNHTVEENAHTIAKSISVLAGKLKIHLQEEDRSLYPKLKGHRNSTLQKIGQTYDEEMKQIFPLFVAYKDQYNTRSKIQSDPQAFIMASQTIFKKLLARLNQEDHNLYPLLEVHSIHS